jgi:pimeloyl-ACP methyl ester carboxylesterase
MPHRTLDGVSLEFRTIPGDAALPWLVFLHEGLGCVSLWRDFPDKLARRLKMRALIYSRRGYGKSDALDGPRKPNFMHDEASTILPALLATFTIERPIFVGHSDGASIALIHASATDRRVTATILMAPHVFVEAITVASIARATEAYETTDLKARLAKHHDHVDDAFLGWSRIWLSPQFATWSLRTEVTNLKSPTLAIQGADDEYGTLAQLDALASAPGPVQRLVLDRCGHSPHRDQEPAILDAISGFVARVIANSKN